MNLDEYRNYVIATRKASQAEALSVLSATIKPTTTTEGKNE